MINDLIERSSSGLVRDGLSCVSSIFEKPVVTAVDDELKVDRRFSPVDVVVDGGEMAVGEGLNFCSTSSSSSSIGKNSDASERSSLDGGTDDDDSGETEVQSSYSRSFVNMEALEEVLPMRRGISCFYNGKSKSFASLADASSLSTMKHIAKPENAYTRRRRNLLANHIWDNNKNRKSPLRSSNGGISKRQTNMSRSTLALAVAMSSSESITTSSDDSNSNSNSRSPPRLPPLHPQTTSPRNFSPWRSYSVVDLRHCNKVDPKN